MQRARRLFVPLVFAALGAAPSTALAADAYPVKPIRIIVPFPPGGLSDGLARILAQNLVQELDRLGLLVRLEEYVVPLGHCQRCDTVIVAVPLSRSMISTTSAPTATPVDSDNCCAAATIPGDTSSPTISPIG